MFPASFPPNQIVIVVVFGMKKSGVVENPGKKSGVQMGPILLLPFVDAGTKDRYNVA